MKAAVDRILAICGALLSLNFMPPASASVEDVGRRNIGDTLNAPFSATVKLNCAHVYLRPESGSPEVGLLREGAEVTVSSCQPDCVTPHAWALLGTDGATRLDWLTPETIAAEASFHPTAESLWYGRVGKSGIAIFRKPRLGGPLLSRERLNREMAFFSNVELRKDGWLERVEGGFVRSRRVKILTPSRFHGENQPHLPIAFVLRDLHGPGKNRAITVHRYDRLPVQAIDRTSVVTSLGPIARNALRIVTRHEHPLSIPPGAKWVLIDLSQQTLTAYEGETAVYATLISSGKNHKESQTHVGMYQVEHKMAYSDMHGEPDDPYDVDRVPYALYFNKNEALHGAYWHDRFGWPTSHGCINLALADAHWLFDWAPPRLPDNWNTIDPKAAGLNSLWVFVKEKAALNQQEMAP
jgi:hypothetical protein